MTNLSSEECCPKFNPDKWDEKIHEWHEKRFVKDHVFTFFYIPINFGGVMRRLDKLVKVNGGKFIDGMALSDHTSKWNMDVYVAVDNEIKGAENVSMSGKFLSKVYEGDFKETGNWCKNFQEFAKEKGLKIEKWFMWYTTCPKCAKKYGKNYVVVTAKVYE